MSERCDHLIWRQSSLCGSGSCVEVAGEPAIVHMRDSEDPTGPRLTFSRTRWAEFIAETKAGEFDLPAKS